MVMLNMVLAIIMDVYAEVPPQSPDSGQDCLVARCADSKVRQCPFFSIAMPSASA